MPVVGGTGPSCRLSFDEREKGQQVAGSGDHGGDLKGKLCAQVACAHKEAPPPDAAVGGASATPAAAAAGGASATPAAAAAGGQQPQKMYVSRLPAGMQLYPGTPLRGSASSGSLGRLSRAATRSAQNLQALALAAADGGGDGGSDAARANSGEVRLDVGGTQQQGVPQQSQQQHGRPSLFSVAYIGSGVYLWGARRDPLYRERVHGWTPNINRM